MQEKRTLFALKFQEKKVLLRFCSQISRKGKPHQDFVLKIPNGHTLSQKQDELNMHKNVEW